MRHRHAAFSSHLVGLALALSSPRAWAQQVPSTLPPYTQRPLTVPAGQLIGRASFGLAASEAPAAFGTTRLVGAGLHFEGQVGLVRSLELSGGFGLRIGSDSATLAADRYGRVDRDEVYQVGNRLVGNPYLRLRWGVFEPSERPVHVGVEATVVTPLASNTVWSVMAGVPVLVVLPAAHLRVETGVFWQFMFSSSAQVRNVLNVPVRVMFQLGPRVALGLVSGVYAANVGAADVSEARVPLGAQAAFRATPNTDVLVQWLYPVMAPYGADAGGVGVTIAGRMR